MRAAALTSVQTKVKVRPIAILLMHALTILIGDDWDELERKAAKGLWTLTCWGDNASLTRFTADKKRVEAGKGHESDNSDRPKKAKSKAKPVPKKR